MIGLDKARLMADQARLGATKNGLRGKSSLTDAEKVSQDFEAVFLGQMLEHMFEGVESNPIGGSSFADDTFRSYMLEEYSKIMSRSGGIGLADHVQREILKLQEVDDYADTGGSPRLQLR